MKKLFISDKIYRNWVINREHIFESVYKHDKEQRIFKFCCQPETGELLFDIPWTHHNIMILAYGKKRFDDYIRGICFWDKNIIYLRMHENEKWLKDTENMLREQGIPKKIKIMWGEKAAKELEEDLREL